MAKTFLISFIFIAIATLSLADRTEDADIFESVSEILKSGFLQADDNKGPKVEWPKQFTMEMTTNTSIYNTTLDFKFDSTKDRIWTRVNYTSPIWGNDEAFQLSLFTKTKNASLKITDECRWAKVKEVGNIYLSLIFYSWSYYTKYNGVNDEGLHVFNLIDYIQEQKTGNVTFFFKDKGEGNPVELRRISILNKRLGIPLSIEVIEPPTETTFTDKGERLFNNLKYRL